MDNMRPAPRRPEEPERPKPEPPFPHDDGPHDWKKTAAHIAIYILKAALSALTLRWIGKFHHGKSDL